MLVPKVLPGRSATICNVAQLSSQQERALDLLVAGRRDSEVADELGINRTTVWRWRTDDMAFQAALNDRRHDAWNAAIEQLRGLVAPALESLAEELEGPRRLRAAIAILEIAGFKSMSKAGIHVRPSGARTEKGIEADRATTDRLLLAIGARKSDMAEEWTLNR